MCRPMNFSIKFDTVKEGCFIIYIKGSHVIIRINVVLANSADLDEKTRSEALHLSLHCLQIYLFTPPREFLLKNEFGIFN